MVSSSAVLRSRPRTEPVRIGLKTDDRRVLATHLGEVLSATYQLLVKTHLHHWNVVGPLFYPLHQMTEAQYEDLFAATDLLAERIRALGHLAPIPQLGAETDKAEVASMSAEKLVEDLINDHEAIVRMMRDAADTADSLKDHVTHDLLTGRMAVHEKAIWMLRSVVTQ